MDSVHPAASDTPAGVAEARDPGTRLARWVIPGTLGAALGVSLMEAGFASLPSGSPVPPRSYVANLIQILPSWLLVVALIPAVFMLCERLGTGPRAWARVLLLHSIGAVVYPILHTLAYVLIMSAIPLAADGPPPFWPTVLRLLRLYSGAEAVTYGAVVAVWYASRFQRRAAEKARDAARLEAALTGARLEALRLQLNPHFLFNTLQAIVSLARADRTSEVSRMVGNLAELLRAVLDSGSAADVRLEEELSLLVRYVEVHRVRFGDRLTVRWDLDPACNDARVPSFILQPLIENALTHGIATRTGPGTLTVITRLENDIVRVHIQDSGPGFSAAPPTNGGIGLSNTRSRLRLRFGDRFGLQAGAGVGAGGDVRLSFPCESASSAGVPE